MLVSTKAAFLPRAYSIGFLLAAMSLPLQSNAANVKISLTIDNSYALFYGTSTAATDFVGADFSWPTTETYLFDLPPDRCFYVVTASDTSVAQGFLGQFENLDTGYKFYSNDVQWQVMATGLRTNAAPTYGAPYSASTTDLALLTNEILDANAGLNPSGVANVSSWVGTTAGVANGGSPWGTRPGIDAAARWVWYNSNNALDPTNPGHNHDEWLVFRIHSAATPVPTPSTLPLVGFGLLLAGLVRTRRRTP